VATTLAVVRPAAPDAIFIIGLVPMFSIWVCRDITETGRGTAIAIDVVFFAVNALGLGIRHE
jgi:hypothetical protein